MEFCITEQVNHDADRVYRVYRDELLELVDYLPSVESVEILEQQQLPGGVRYLYRWLVLVSVPVALRPLLTNSKITYLDHNEWVDQALEVNWRLQTNIFTEAVTCTGVNSFKPGSARNTTEVKLSGRLDIDLSRVRGVPRLLWRLGPRLERFILDQVKPNLVGVTRAVGLYLDARGGS